MSHCRRLEGPLAQSHQFYLRLHLQRILLQNQQKNNHNKTDRKNQQNRSLISILPRLLPIKPSNALLHNIRTAEMHKDEDKFRLIQPSSEIKHKLHFEQKEGR